MSRFPKEIALLALALATACGEHAIASPPPRDRFFFPTGMAVRHLPSGQTQLLVVSSNYDLRYDTGMLLSVDPDASGNARPPDGSPGDSRLSVLGSAPVDSFGGELEVAEAAACPPLWENLAVTTSRQSIAAYFFSLGDDGALACGSLCKFPLDQSYADPYGVVVACSSFYPRASAFFTYLRGPQNEGLTTEVPLATDANGVLLTAPGSTGRRTGNGFDLGLGDVHSGAFDPATGRLFFTPSNTVGADPLRWFELTVPRLYSPPFPVQSYDLYRSVRGSTGRGIALSKDGTRAYVTLVLYDALEASRSGSIFVQGSALAILDIRPDPTGLTIPRLLDVVPLEAGAAEIRVIGRPGLRDLLAITCSDAGSLELYDDEMGQVVKTIGASTVSGLPVLGRQPFGLALEEHPDPSRCTSTGGGPCARLFVGSFEQGTVGIVEVDPQRPWNASLVKVLGVAQ